MADNENTVGRPSKYDPALNETVKNYCLLGATDIELANFLGVCEATINNWKQNEPEFLESIKEGKEIADKQVVLSLNKRANGYEYEEETTENVIADGIELPIKKKKIVKKQIAPDVTAQIFWLKNRRPAEWRDKQEIDLKVSTITELIDKQETTETNTES